MQLYFSGTIDHASYNYQSWWFGTQPSEVSPPALHNVVPVGTHVQGSFSYDPASEPYQTWSWTQTFPPSSGAITTQATYYGGEFSAQVGDIGLWAPTSSISVTDDFLSWTCCVGSPPGVVEIRHDSFSAGASSFNGLETSGSAYPALSVGFPFRRSFRSPTTGGQGLAMNSKARVFQRPRLRWKTSVVGCTLTLEGPSTDLMVAFLSRIWLVGRSPILESLHPPRCPSPARFH